MVRKCWAVLLVLALMVPGVSAAARTYRQGYSLAAAYRPELEAELRRDLGFIQLSEVAGFDADEAAARARRTALTGNEIARRIDLTGKVPRDAGLAVPQLFQYDYKTVICYYNGAAKSVHSSGCSATCLSMIVAYLTGNLEQSPEVLFRWACESGLYSGKGLWYTQISAVAEHWGVKGEWIGKEPERVLAALRAGRPVLAHMGPGTFTAGGHYIVLRGIDADGKIIVNDPGSADRTKAAYDLDLIVRETKADSPFMICSVIKPKPIPKPQAETQ